MSHTRLALASQTEDIRNLIIHLLDIRAELITVIHQSSEETAMFVFPFSHLRISISGFSLKKCVWNLKHAAHQDVDNYAVSPERYQLIGEFTQQGQKVTNCQAGKGAEEDVTRGLRTVHRV